METPKVEIALAGHYDQAIQTITLGFLADPMGRWVWPDAETYLEAMPEFAAAFSGKAFEHGSAYVANGGKAAALWLPPGVEPDGEAIDELFETSVAPEIADDLASVFAQMEHHHPTDRPCWYLPLMAADPAYMGKGLGGAMLKRALQRCDEEGLMAYLEGTSARNVSLYERHGFEVVGTIQAGSSPTLFPMTREPKREGRPAVQQHDRRG